MYRQPAQRGEQEGLHCLNCKLKVMPDEAQFFEGVLVCAGCSAAAERFYQRGKKELQQLLTLQKEAIRIALVEGKFHFGREDNREVSKTDLLRAIVELEEVRSKTRKAAAADDPNRKPMSRVVPSSGLLPPGGPFVNKRKG